MENSSLFKPSKKNVKTFLADIRKTIKAARAWSAADLINELNPKIRGWANYHGHVVSKRTFSRMDHDIFSSLWLWERRRHPTKNQRWIKIKYFEQCATRNWIFTGEMDITDAMLLRPVSPLLRYVNQTLVAWAQRKFKRFKREATVAGQFVERLATEPPNLFVHWQLGMTGTFV